MKEGQGQPELHNKTQFLKTEDSDSEIKLNVS